MTGMRRVCGVDTSLTSTGIATITQRVDGTTLANATTITSRGKRNDTLNDRSQRLITLGDEILHVVALAELVVIEGPSHGSRGGSPLDRHGLWWAIVGKLVDLGIPVAVCAPTTRARFATGVGNADKAAVSSRIIQLWPDVVIHNSDESDALCLAHAGAVKLGWTVRTLQRHLDALDAVSWPPGFVRSPEPMNGTLSA